MDNFNQNDQNSQNDQSSQLAQPRPGLAELVYGILFAPTATFRRISEQPPLFHGFLVFLTVIVLTALANTLIPPDWSGIPPEFAGAAAKAGPYLGIIGALFAFLGWFLQAGVFQLFAEFLGGRGRAVGVLTVLALAELPRVLVIPFRVIGYFLTSPFFGKFLTIAVSLVVFVWWIILLVIGLRETQQFSTGRAVATLAIPFGISVLALLTVTAALVGLVMPFIGDGI